MSTYICMHTYVKAHGADHRGRPAWGRGAHPRAASFNKIQAVVGVPCRLRRLSISSTSDNMLKQTVKIYHSRLSVLKLTSARAHLRGHTYNSLKDTKSRCTTMHLAIQAFIRFLSNERRSMISDDQISREISISGKVPSET